MSRARGPISVADLFPWPWPFIWAVFDVSNDVILRKPVAETKKDSVSCCFCCQITSAWNACPAHLLRAKHISHPTRRNAFGPAGGYRLGPDRLGTGDSVFRHLAIKSGLTSTARNENNEKTFWRKTHLSFFAPPFFQVHPETLRWPYVDCS